MVLFLYDACILRPNVAEYLYIQYVPFSAGLTPGSYKFRWPFSNLPREQNIIYRNAKQEPLVSFKRPILIFSANKYIECIWKKGALVTKTLIVWWCGVIQYKLPGIKQKYVESESIVWFTSRFKSTIWKYD